MCVLVDMVSDPVSVCTCGQSLGSLDCVNIRKKFGIMSMCIRAEQFRLVYVRVRVDRVRDHVSVCSCGHRFKSFECVKVWTEFGIV